jgi:hypothetical protein
VDVTSGLFVIHACRPAVCDTAEQALCATRFAERQFTARGVWVGSFERVGLPRLAGTLADSTTARAGRSAIFNRFQQAQSAPHVFLSAANAMLSHDQNNRWMLMLEITIVPLFVIDLVMLFLGLK